MNAQGKVAAVGDRARRNTISDAFRRSAMRNGPLPALSFAGRDWTYAALDRAVNRVAAKLIELGLQKGDRVAAYGKNSDAYLILWLASCRIGTVHVPVNYALTGRELTYILKQSGAKAVFHDASLAATVEAVLPSLSIGVRGTIQSGSGTDILAFAQVDSLAGNEVDAEVADTDLAQFLYTSGTTADPKGAMMTHRALLSEYMACAIELEMSYRDKSLDALPLYHSAQMHVFLMPHLLIGAESVLIEAPAPDICLKLIEEHEITSFFAPPTVWIGLLRHPDFDKRDLSSLKNVYYGASIMPVPVLQELRRRLPGARPFNCYGQSEIAPMATLLRPEEHDARPARPGGRSRRSRRGWSTRR